jgi:archaellum component FlaC
MGTVLRVLVVIILVLSGAALFLSVKLYGKRELLINRAHVLEEQVRKFAQTLEAADAPDAVQPNYVAKDVSPVTSKEMDNPERSPFWNTYQYKLETPNLPVMNLTSDEKKLQLRQYYQLVKDPASGKMIKQVDPVTQGFSTKGPGTMQALLDEVQDRATKQLQTLNKTRVELQKVREELGTTIEEFNKLKQEGRADKKTIDEKNKMIDNLNEEIRGLKKKVEGLEEEKKTLTAEVAEAKAEIDKQKAVVDDLTKQVKDLREALKRKPDGRPGDKISPVSPAEAYQGAPGDKGKIVAVDEKLKFVVVDVSDDAIKELIGEQRDRALPQVDMMVRRPGLKSATGEFVTRIKFRQVLRQKNLVVADILIDWQQAPVEVNDVVFF